MQSINISLSSHWLSGLFVRFFLSLCLFLGSMHAHAQQYEEQLKYPGKTTKKKCSNVLEVMRKMPMEARYGVSIEGNQIYIEFPNQSIYHKLIRGNRDGFAIDLVFKEQYGCNVENTPTHSYIRGQLQRPVYKKELKQRTALSGFNGIRIHMGDLPAHVSAQEVEPNLILISKRWACNYISILDIDLQDWELLETGLYRDTLNQGNQQQSDTTALHKTLHFTIPFKKNQAKYEQKDIAALYDSLQLNDYQVVELRISAYTSVEGSLEHNLKLQKQRAEALAKAIEEYQGLPVRTSIRSRENWVEFLDDIQGTSYQKLAQLSKEEIKHQLQEPEVVTALEPMLQKHRKGLIELRLQKKVSFWQESPDKLTRYFDQYLKEENVPRALYLQQLIFSRIKDESLPAEFLEQLEVPQHPLFAPLLVERLLFDFSYLKQSDQEALQAFEELQQLLPDNTALAYNITALRSRIWAAAPSKSDAKELYQEIISLRKKGAAPALVKRMLINYYIVMAQLHLLTHEYKDKDRYLRQIYSTYRDIPLSDPEALRLAKFFAFYSHFDWAEKVLHSYVKQLNVSEDLVFYYISLTIAQKRHTQSTAYRQILNNAYNSNPARYCKLFNTRGFGGISFQLLANPYLKQTYCDSCSDRAAAE